MGMRRAAFVVAALAAVAAVLLWMSCAGTTESPTPRGSDAPAAGAERRVPTPAPRGPRAQPGVTDAAAEPQKPSDAAAGREEAAPAPAGPQLRIHGRVREESGRGVAGAELEIRAWSSAEPNVLWFTVKAQADDNGTFDVSIDAVRASIGFGIETSADGHLEGWVSVKRAEYDEAQGVDVVVERGRAIVGRVIDGDGRAIPGTTLLLWYGSETTWPTDVGEDGRFRTPQRGPRRAFELLVEVPGFARRLVPVAAADAGETDIGDVVFRRGSRIAGLVVDRSGRPVQDVRLTLEIVVGHDGREPRCRTDSVGRFEFTDLGEDPVNVYVDATDMGGPEGARRRFRGFEANVRPGRTDVRIVATADATIWLRFVDVSTGKPVDVKKAEYGLRYEGTPEPEHLGQGALGSDPLFSTVVSAECGRRYDLTVRCPGFDVARVNGIEVGDVAEMDVRVPMRRSQ